MPQLKRSRKSNR